jgi:SAM-dependent methyltransferase
MARDESLALLRHRTNDPEYKTLVAREAEMWANAYLDFERAEAMVPSQLQWRLNEALTGRAEVHWFDDLTNRGPFSRAATLGATTGFLERRWLERRASDALDIYELSSGVIQKTRERLSTPGLLKGVRFIEADLNVAELPAQHYDVIWSAGSLHHLVSLEHVCAQVHGALKPGGLFAFYEYVGEPRVQFDPLRIRLSEEALREVPARFWRGKKEVKSPSLDDISPFEAVRSDEIHAIVTDHFETVHWAQAAVLVPAGYAVDFVALAAEAPELVERFVEAEKRTLDSGLGGCTAYGVFRRAS